MDSNHSHNPSDNLAMPFHSMEIQLQEATSLEKDVTRMKSEIERNAACSDRKADSGCFALVERKTESISNVESATRRDDTCCQVVERIEGEVGDEM